MQTDKNTFSITNWENKMKFGTIVIHLSPQTCKFLLAFFTNQEMFKLPIPQTSGSNRKQTKRWNIYIYVFL